MALEVRSREEDRRFHAWHGALGDAQLARRPQESALEVLRLGVVEVERVVDRPGAVGASEVPGGSVVLQPPRVTLDLDQVQARGHRDQQVALVDTARLRGEGERGPSAIGLGGRHQAAYMVESVLLPGVRGWPILEPLLRRTRRSGLGHRTRSCCRHRPTSAVRFSPSSRRNPLADLTVPHRQAGSVFVSRLGHGEGGGMLLGGNDGRRHGRRLGTAPPPTAPPPVRHHDPAPSTCPSPSDTGAAALLRAGRVFQFRSSAYVAQAVGKRTAEISRRRSAGRCGNLYAPCRPATSRSVTGLPRGLVPERHGGLRHLA